MDCVSIFSTLCILSTVHLLVSQVHHTLNVQHQRPFLLQVPRAPSPDVVSRASPQVSDSVTRIRPGLYPLLTASHPRGIPITPGPTGSPLHSNDRTMEASAHQLKGFMGPPSTSAPENGMRETEEGGASIISYLGVITGTIVYGQ